MKSIDYGWVIGLAVIVLLVFTWKPIMGVFGAAKDKMGNKEGYERGKVLFYDATYWLGPDHYKSCAMCHATDFTPDPNKKIDMKDYVAGSPMVLKDIHAKYDGGTIQTGNELYEQVMRCLTTPSRIGGGKISSENEQIKDLLVYVSKQ